MSEIYFAVGLSLGQPGEPTALAVVRREGEREDLRFTLEHLERFEVGTALDRVAGKLRAIVTREPLFRRERKYRQNRYHSGSVIAYDVDHYPPVAIDATGASEAELEALRQAVPAGVDVSDFILTNGATAARGSRTRRNLAGVLQMHFQRKRLVWSRGLRLAELFAEELGRFRVKPPPGRTDADRAYREGAHDDLVLAVGAAVMRAEWAGPVVDAATARILADPIGHMRGSWKS